MGIQEINKWLGVICGFLALALLIQGELSLAIGCAIDCAIFGFNYQFFKTYL